MTNTQYIEPIHNNIFHLIMKMKVTLTDDEGHRRMLKVIKNELMVISRKLLHLQTSNPVSEYDLN